jgi:antitoxin component of MazEF toxin-antitoxin module
MFETGALPRRRRQGNLVNDPNCVYTFGYTMLETKIARYGNSLTVRLPAALARDLDLHEGDRVTLRRIDHGVAVERRHGTRLAAWLATVREPETEIGHGPPVGNEVLD